MLLSNVSLQARGLCTKVCVCHCRPDTRQHLSLLPPAHTLSPPHRVCNSQAPSLESLKASCLPDQDDCPPRYLLSQVFQPGCLKFSVCFLQTSPQCLKFVRRSNSLPHFSVSPRLLIILGRQKSPLPLHTPPRAVAKFWIIPASLPLNAPASSMPLNPLTQSQDNNKPR